MNVPVTKRGAAWRRAQMEKVKHRVSHYFGRYMLNLPEPEKSRHIGIHAHTPKRCSHCCCGNERRHFGTLPRQWRRANQEAQYDN